MFGDRLLAKAEKEFPAFCHDWESKLRDRERNNIAHLDWKDSNGIETSTYTGYGSIQSCTCKQSSKGIPVGKLYYQEFEYRLEGKTLDEARHATPKPDTVTNTTEIFRWDKKQDKWIYTLNRPHRVAAKSPSVQAAGRIPAACSFSILPLPGTGFGSGSRPEPSTVSVIVRLIRIPPRPPKAHGGGYEPNCP